MICIALLAAALFLVWPVGQAIELTQRIKPLVTVSPPRSKPKKRPARRKKVPNDRAS